MQTNHDAHCDHGCDRSVRSHAVRPVQRNACPDADGEADEELDQAGRLELVPAFEPQLADREDHDEHAERNERDVEEVALSELMLVALPLSCEDRTKELEVGRFVGTSDLDLPDKALGQAELEADQREERTERDDEAWLARSLDHPAIEEADPESKRQRHRDRHDER